MITKQEWQAWCDSLHNRPGWSANIDRLRWRLMFGGVIGASSFVVGFGVYLLMGEGIVDALRTSAVLGVLLGCGLLALHHKRWDRDRERISASEPQS